jgi:hypothetical protein
MEGVWIDPVGAQVIMAFVLRILEPRLTYVFDVQVLLEPLVRPLFPEAGHLYPAEGSVGG